jgi:hypothetical protein
MNVQLKNIQETSRRKEDADKNEDSTMRTEDTSRRRTKLTARFEDYELYGAYCLMTGNPTTYSETMKAGEGWDKAIKTELGTKHKTFGTRIFQMCLPLSTQKFEAMREKLLIVKIAD